MSAPAASAPPPSALGDNASKFGGANIPEAVECDDGWTNMIGSDALRKVSTVQNSIYAHTHGRFNVGCICIPLQRVIREPEDPDARQADEGETVTIRYEGRVKGSDVVFDSSDR
jgi:hypothetical protein